jgi:hypothetical protein
VREDPVGQRLDQETERIVQGTARVVHHASGGERAYQNFCV